MNDKAAQAPPLIEIDKLEVYFPPPVFASRERKRPLRAVDGISLTVGQGEALGVVGESGCGKSTIARVLVGLLRPTGGWVRLKGMTVDFNYPLPLMRAAQMVFQDPASSLNPRMRIGAQITEPLRGHLGIISREKRAAAAVRLLRQVGLDPDTALRYPHEFSGGQRQRIALARALAIEPDLLVADEPVSSLDVAAQAEITKLLRRLHGQKKLALLFISHDLGSVSALTERVAIIYLGKVMEEGPTDVVLREPAHPYTQALLDAAPRLEGGRRERIVLPGDPPSPYKPPPGCVFHTRCPRALERCSRQVPPFYAYGSERKAACFLLESYL